MGGVRAVCAATTPAVGTGHRGCVSGGGSGNEGRCGNGGGMADDADGVGTVSTGRDCCNWQGLSPVLMPLTGLAPASPYFGLRAMGQLSFPQ